MKNKSIISTILTLFLLLMSCNEYETRVTNIVHPDGSVTRKVVMSKKEKDPFEPGKYLVPVDSSWDITYSMSISDKNDTTWTLTAEKLFSDVDDINAGYDSDTAANSSMKRHASFDTRYRWFFTVCHFEEKVDRILETECPIDTFMTPEELRYFYLPDFIRGRLENGKDSITYKNLSEDVEAKFEKCLWMAVIKQMILDFHTLASQNSKYHLSLEDLQARENDFYEKLVANEGNDDYEGDQLIKDVMGEDFYESFQTEIDSASDILLEAHLQKYEDAKDYDMEIIMPGKLISSNGYVETNDTIASNNNIVWSLSGDYFFTQDYVMWAESRIINVYAWIISGIVVLLALLLLVFRKKKN